jgi:4-amino-4-deoxy-L-arabinose transferase-like glycosyltransferase
VSGPAPDLPASRLQPAQLALLAAACVPTFFWGLGRYGVVNADEAIYHGIAERMVASGDWLRLDFRGEARFYDSFLNAPLHYWARAALISLFGSGAWTMRVLSAAAGAGAVLVTAGLAARVAGARAGMLAGGVLLTSFQLVFLHGARTGELDALVSLCLVAAAWLFLRGVEDGRSFVPHHLALCALLWTKAPLVLPVAAIELAHFAASRAARPRLRAYLVTGLACLPLALAWHALQAVLWWEQAPAVLATMWDQARGARTDGQYSGRLGNAAFYLRTLAWGLFPWSAALPFALVFAAREPRLRPLLVWPLALLAFFVLVAKHYAWYLLPAYPFFAIALGAWLAALPRLRPLEAGVAAVAVLLALVAVDAVTPNPFAQVALTYPMELRLRVWPGLTALALLCGLGLLFAFRTGPRARKIAALVLAAALFLPALLRVAAPLYHLDQVSAMQRLRDSLARARAEGRAIEYPVRLPPGSAQIARFLFAEDYEIEVRQAPGATTLWLHPAGDPAVLDRSIGRRGLERRLARPGLESGPGDG